MGVNAIGSFENRVSNSPFQCKLGCKPCITICSSDDDPSVQDYLNERNANAITPQS